MRYLVPALVIALPVLFVALWVRSCSGPDASVAGVELLQPVQPGQPFRVIVKVRNEGSGTGEVLVSATLRDRHTGATFKGDQQLDLDKDQTASAVVEIGAPPGDYEAEAEVTYPPG